MIWIILTFLGIPLWFCAVALGILLRGRHRIKHLPGGFGCKVRIVSGQVPGLKSEFSRITGVGNWIHAVLILHGGNPFLARTSLCGIQAVESGPSEIDPATVKRIDDPVAVRFRHDNGATLELACARHDLDAMLGPFAQQQWPADAPAHRPPPAESAS
ncbi:MULTISPECIES: hypothetical protein [Rhodococcus]|uniref:hypothetical protein n=1 Tax=Rhodococcus TaxID=1827 RepID=UPI00143E701D|nr:MULTISPECIES: hypothetical protein [Rhodococcus]MBC2590488.1 hypothetical protein [Rhodococcus aetherivorans]QIX48314.1 hypothetical protein HFP48_01160 [Rhodococcus sp. DMU1]QRI76603.1 hypothetical protein JQ505_02035 [Rhodococcus aetherivorans]QSE60019.1 hypothetical protein JYA75_03150 [Rhodococcus sp. PSBB066]QSE68675.1 hypothetical protein JYA91_24445 [Rhodococcus sp. PSBB049]